MPILIALCHETFTHSYAMPALFRLSPLSAQKDLQIGKFFDSSYGKRKDATETLIKGKQLKPYKLSLFRSLTLPIHAVNIAELEKAIKTDTKEAIDKEAGSKGARLYYGFYQLRPIDKTRRYLFFRNNSLNSTTSRQTRLRSFICKDRPRSTN